MKYLDLIVVTGIKASQKHTYQLLSGKNQIGSDVRCQAQVNLQLVEPEHFELFVTKSGRITLIPLVSNMQIKNKKTIENMEINQCYDIELKTYSFYVEQSVDKKSSTKLNILPQKSLWLPKNKQLDCLQTLKKVKIDVDNINFEESSYNFSTQSKSEMNDVDKELLQQDTEYAQYDYDHDTKFNDDNQNIKNFCENDSQFNIIDEFLKIIDESDIKQNIDSSDTSILIQEQPKQKQIQCNKHRCRIILSNCELDKDQKTIMKQLGATFIENQDEEFDVIVMDSFKRRAKLLIALNQQAKIVSKDWILDCIDDNELIQNYKDYFLQVPQEDALKYNFDLDDVQYENCENKGYQLYNNCEFILQSKYKSIPIQDLKSIIKSGGGNIISKQNITNNKLTKYHVVEQESISSDYKTKGIIQVDPEFILLSSLKQNLQNKFFHKK